MPAEDRQPQVTVKDQRFHTADPGRAVAPDRPGQQHPRLDQQPVRDCPQAGCRAEISDQCTALPHV